MIVLIVDKYAHRYLSSGQMESAPVLTEYPETLEGKGYTLGRFVPSTPEFLGMSGGQYSEISEHLNRLTTVFPEGLAPIPQKPPYVATVREGVVVK